MLHPEIRRFAAWAVIALALVVLLNAIRPQTRQFIDLRLTSSGAPAAGVQFKFIEPEPYAFAECEGSDPGVIGANPATSGADGTSRLRRRVSQKTSGYRRSGSSNSNRNWLMALCANVNGSWVRLWRDDPEGPRRFLRLDCELTTHRCQAQYTRQLDETLQPVMFGVGVGFWVLLGVLGNRGSIGWGSTWLGPQCFLYPIVQAYASWLQAYPAVSKVVAVALLVWAGVLLYRISRFHLDRRRWYREHRQRLS